MKTNFAKFQAEQFEKRNKVVVSEKKTDKEVESVDVIDSVEETAPVKEETKKKSFFGKKK